MALFKAIVKDVWKERRKSAMSEVAAIERRISDLELNRSQLLQAHLYDQRIDDDLYRQESARLVREIALAKKELSDAQIEELDVSSVLAFSERVILDARRLWAEGCLIQRQRLQSALFPEGVTYNCEMGFGTARTTLFYNWLETISGANEGMAARRGFEPLSPP